ncbi:MAG: hypothetical protein AB1483_13850 [Candidatus Zixiibacteriota bacterium]
MTDFRRESSRHQMKQNYQPNMAKGWGVVFVLVVLFAIWTANWEQGEIVRLDVKQAGLPSDIRFDPERVERSSEMAAKRSIGGYNPRAHEHDGFLGFDVKIIKDDQPLRIDIEKPPVYSTEIEDELSVGSDISFSVIEAEGGGIYVPEGTDLLAEHEEQSQKPVVNSDACLIRSVKPEVPWIAQENKKEGRVDVLVLIDKTGQPIPYSCKQADGVSTTPEYMLDCRMKDGSVATLEFCVSPQSSDNKLLYVVLHEEPKGYYFAEKLTEKLPDWKFAPAIRNNEPVVQFVIVQFRFCNPDDPDCQSIILAGAST